MGQSNVILKQTAEKSITPQTLNYLVGGGTESSGYTFTISDIRLFSSFEGTGIDTPQAAALNSTQTTGTSVSKTVIGTTLSLRATGVNTLFGSNSTLYATLTIVGRDSGARLQIPVNITKTTTA